MTRTRWVKILWLRDARGERLVEDVGGELYVQTERNAKVSTRPATSYNSSDSRLTALSKLPILSFWCI